MFMRMIYDDKLAQAAYLIGCQATGQAIVIDPERDIDRYLDLASDNGLTIVAAAETHIHADFLSGSRELAERTDATLYLSDEGDDDWKYQWLDQRTAGGSYNHRLLKHNDTFSIGNIEFRALHTPGHTPEHICLLVTDHGSGADQPIGILTGDFLFVGDLGRPDLLETAAGQTGAMEPAARTLYRTLDTLKDLPDFIQVWPAHGAGSACGKALGAVPASTVGYEKRFNQSLNAASSEQHFVEFILAGQPEPPLYFANMKRDNKLGPPVLGALPTPSRISPAQLAQHTTRVIADTRPWDRFRSAHIRGSLSFPLIKSFNTDAGSMIRDTDEICLIIDPERLDEAIRDLVRIGLDRITAWCPADELESAIASGAIPTDAVASIDEVDTARAEELISRGEVNLLDVRRATEYDEGHIDHAVNIAHTRLADHLDRVPTGKPLLINCRSGARSARAAAYLAKQGHTPINLAGGYLAWNSINP